MKCFPHFFVICILFVIATGECFATEINGKKLIKAALKNGSQVSYTVTGKLPTGQVGTYSQLVLDDSRVLRRFVPENKTFKQELQNEDGGFLISSDGRVAGAVHSFTFAAWDDLTRPLDLFTLANADCVVTPFVFQNYPAYSVRLSQNDKVKMSFTILEQSKLIVERKWYDANGVLLRHVAFEALSMTPPEKELFALTVPAGTPVYDLSTQADAYLNKTTVRDPVRAVRRSSSSVQKILRFLTKPYNALVFGGGSILLILAALLIRKYRK